MMLILIEIFIGKLRIFADEELTYSIDESQNRDTLQANGFGVNGHGIHSSDESEENYK